MERVAAIPAGKDSGMPTGLLQTAGQMQHHGGLARASYRNIADADDGNSKAAPARDHGWCPPEAPDSQAQPRSNGQLASTVASSRVTSIPSECIAYHSSRWN